MKRKVYTGADACVFCRREKGTERTIGAARPCCYSCFRIRWVF